MVNILILSATGVDNIIHKTEKSHQNWKEYVQQMLPNSIYIMSEEAIKKKIFVNSEKCHISINKNRSQGSVHSGYQ
jgi:hypothetical protein